MSNALKVTANLSAKEKRALLARLLRERAGRSRTTDQCAHHLFEAQARLSPEAVAVVAGDVQLSYRELDLRSNQLAHHLRSLGVGPDSLVGLCVERSTEMLVALLGILKAGGAYVPLDPTYPRDRLAFMVDDAAMPLLIAQEHLRDVLPQTQTPILCLDSARDLLDRQSDEAIAVDVAAENLAYVIYTSGSTGKPKGVQIPHSALVNFLESMRREPGLNQNDVLLALTTLSFDIAALELFLPLVVGARVVIVDRQVAADGLRLAAAIRDSAANVIQATPATWRLLLGSGWTGDPKLKLLCGGEALARDLADQLLQGRCGSLWNMYGPTETTVWSALAKVEPGEGAVPIGRPIANTRIYILDNRLKPVPVGVTGELYIGGMGLARGYVNRPDLTADRFLPDPFSDEPGARLYRTGDLARYRHDGSLECLGRIDHQVKIRGFRIELGEIESALAKHPAVREAVVVAREDTPGDKRLVAYIIANPVPTSAEMWEWLKDKLPEYMVPSAVVPLDSLPQTPNGKIDRKALPAPELSRTTLESGFVAPRGPIEEALAGIWAGVLGREHVGVHDNFFILGGHSLKAAQLLSRVLDTFGVELPLRSLFEGPTVAGLARRLEEALQAGPGLQAPPVVPISREGQLPASFAQQRLWFLDQLEPGQQTYNVPRAVRLIANLNVEAFEQTLNEVIRRHEVLRTRFTSHEGVPVPIIDPSLKISLPLVDLTHLPESEREPEAIRLAKEEAERPFDLANDALIRGSLLRLDTRVHVLLLTMHHIISDDWSISILIREVTAIYEAYSRGLPSPLPELPIQYLDFAAWQRRWLQGDVFKAHIDYWRKQLAGMPVLELPTDRPRPAALGQKGGSRWRIFPKPLAIALRDLSRQEGATLFMTLLAGFETLLARYSGQEDFAVGSPIAGRSRSETENLIGFFVNNLVLRADLSGNPSFREVLRRVRQSSLGAYAHQEMPFDQLVVNLLSKRDPSRPPLFQVMFTFQNIPMPMPQLPDFTMNRLEADTGMSKFELSLNVSEVDQGLKGELEYNSDLFNEATIDRMLEHYQTLLDGIVANPDQSIATLPMLSESERRKVLQWNNSWVDHAPVQDEAPDLGISDLDRLSDEELSSLLRKIRSGHDDVKNA